MFGLRTNELTGNDRGAIIKDIPKRLQLIIYLGETGDCQLETNILSAIKFVYNDFIEIVNSQPETVPKYLEMIVQCAEEIPVRTAVYGTFVRYLHAKNVEYAKSILGVTMTHFYNYLESGDTRRTRLLLRFLAELMNNQVISQLSFADLLNTLIQNGVKNQTAPGYTEWLYYHILSVLPFCRKEFFVEQGTLLQPVFQKIEEISKSNINYPSSESPLIGESLETSFHQLSQQISSLDLTEFHCESILQPYLQYESETKTEMEVESESEVLSLDINIPELDSSKVYSLLHVINQQDTTTKVETEYLVVIRQYVMDIIDSFYPDPQTVANCLINIPGQGEHFHLITIDILISHLLSLPTPPHPSAFYNRIIQLCVTDTKLLNAFAKYFFGLFEKCSKIRLVCRDRICEWLASFLNSVSYDWPWKKMKEVPNYSNTDARYLFLNDLFSTCLQYTTNLSESTLIDSSIKDEFIKDIKLSFSYLDDYKQLSDTLVEKRKTILGLITSKSDGDQIHTSITNDDPNFSSEHERIIWISCFIEQSAISMTHLHTYSKRYVKYFVSLLHDSTDGSVIPTHANTLFTTITKSYLRNYQQQFFIYQALIRDSIITAPLVIGYLIKNTEDLSKPIFYHYNYILLILHLLEYLYYDEKLEQLNECVDTILELIPIHFENNSVEIQRLWCERIEEIIYALIPLKIDILEKVRSIFAKPPLNTFTDGSTHCFTH